VHTKTELIVQPVITPATMLSARVVMVSIQRHLKLKRHTTKGVKAVTKNLKKGQQNVRNAISNSNIVNLGSIKGQIQQTESALLLTLILIGGRLVPIR